ncbi:prostaglandin reductase 3-like [Argiope bruennichi]|uniref:prostaglandin reductase 3-like n=1 Tax=Argiope bruennichi TaxID=94029 RepID=UPI002494160D|nr:prostaglandin reductase 3-like [Argiope bruennichi]
MAERPKTFKKLMVQKLTSNFREAVSIEISNMCHPSENEVCIRNKYVGINATDVNVTKGRYASVGAKLPFGVGLEGLGEIVEVGENVKDLKIGQYVAYMNSKINSYAEFVCIPVEEVYPIPELNPEYLVLLVSGATASIGLDKCARITEKEKVLITAAAGGAGHIAVQWAKAAGCYVIGTCSTEEKEKALKELGCDRVINYKKEDLAEVLQKEYQNGIDVIWETIGGQVFETCIKNIANRGRLVIVGGISSYKSEDSFMPKLDLSFLPELLLFRSAAVLGFRRAAYRECFTTYFKFLSESLEKGDLKTLIDNGEKSAGGEFFGMEGIIKGVEHLHTGKSIGKVIARLY